MNLSNAKDHLNRLNEKLRYFAPFELVEQLEKHYQSDTIPLTTGFPTIDRNLRHKLRGKLGAYVGYGGTRKSLAALNCGVGNRELRSIYSTMEMGAVELLERIIDLTIPNEQDSRNPSTYFEQELKAHKKAYSMLADELKQIYGYNLVIAPGSRMRPEDYRELCRDYKEKHGIPDILIVDGLSMMGGDGNENETFTANSSHLKELAIELNIFIVIICHVSRGLKKTTRCNYTHIRGSEKILDNVDFIVQFSLVEDAYLSAERGQEIYRNDLGWIQVWFKRGNGKIIDFIYELNEQTLEMKETSINPYELDKKESGAL